MSKKILISLSVIAGVIALVAGGTIAFFSDTETSSGNTFMAGSIDLKIDNECSYNGQQVQDCTWLEEKDLEEGDVFFNFTDLKPGDYGEDTISLHVHDNDAWGRIRLANVEDKDNTCTEPEKEDEPNCEQDEDGELDENMEVMIWLDQGYTPGFQGKDEDTGEGDNVWQEGHEPVITTTLTADWTYELKNIIAQAYQSGNCEDEDDCPGLTEDGHLKGSITYYIGVAWCFGKWDEDGNCDGSDVDNTPQTDSLSGDIIFEVEQYRNNPNPSFGG